MRPLFKLAAILGLPAFLFCQNAHKPEPIITQPGAPEVVDVTALSETTVQVCWIKLPETVQYHVFRSVQKHAGYQIAATTQDYHLLDTGLTAGATYYYRVQAENVVGPSPLSQIHCVTTIPPAPSVPTATALSDSTIEVTWVAEPHKASVLLYRSTDQGDRYKLVGQSTRGRLVDSLLAANITYYYRIRAENASGRSRHSEPAGATTFRKAPDQLKVKALEDHLFQISWRSVPGTSGYEIHRSRFPDKGFRLIATTVESSYVDSNAAYATVYYYKVRATGHRQLSYPAEAHRILSWTALGRKGFSAAIAEDTQLEIEGGVAFIAYKDPVHGYATVKKYDQEGEKWVRVGLGTFTTGPFGTVRLCVSGGEPYVAYQDMTNGYRISVQRFDGVEWKYVGSPGFSSGPPQFIDMSVDGETVYVAYAEPQLGGKAVVKMSTGVGWVNVGNDGFSDGPVEEIRICANGGKPFVAFRDLARDGKATVMAYGTKWDTVGNAGCSDAIVQNLSLETRDSVPYLAYSDYAKGWKATVMKLEETIIDSCRNGQCDRTTMEWSPVGGKGFSLRKAEYLSFEIADRVPYVAFGGEKAVAMRFESGRWDTLGTAGFSDGAAMYTSMAVWKGKPYVAYKDLEHGSRATVLKYD